MTAEEMQDQFRDQKNLSDQRNQCAYAIVGWAMACVDSVQDHDKRQSLRALIERYKAADVRLEDFYRRTEVRA